MTPAAGMKRFLVSFSSARGFPIVATSYEVEQADHEEAELAAISLLETDFPGELPPMEINCRALDGSRRR
jgi:hypothetical protein